MKKKFIIFVVCLISLQTFTLVSCVQDDIYFYNDDLSISSHTPMTRNAMENEILSIPDKEDNMEYDAFNNTCALVALVEEWIAQQDGDYFTGLCNTTAQDYYNMLLSKFKEQNPNWTVGEPITDEQFLAFTANMYGERKFIDDAVTYFSNIQNRQNIVFVYLENGNDGHYAYVSSVENEYIVIRGQKIVPRNEIYFCGTKGWNIVGVVYKKPKQ